MKNAAMAQRSKSKTVVWTFILATLSSFLADVFKGNAKEKNTHTHTKSSHFLDIPEIAKKMVHTCNKVQGQYIFQFGMVQDFLSPLSVLCISMCQRDIKSMALRPGQVHYSPEKAICIQKQYPVNKTAPRLKLPIDTYLSNLQARLLTELDVLGPAQDCTELSTVFNSSPLLMFTTSSWNCYFALHLPWRISSQIDQMPLRFLLFVCDLFSSES